MSEDSSFVMDESFTMYFFDELNQKLRPFLVHFTCIYEKKVMILVDNNQVKTVQILDLFKAVFSIDEGDGFFLIVKNLGRIVAKIIPYSIT